MVTDNDGDYEKKVQNKFEPFNNVPTIKICADSNNNLNTLEPQFIDSNKDHLNTLREIFEINNDKYPDEKSISEYMQNNKTDCALKIFNTNKDIKFPQYILNSINWEYE